MEINYNSSKQNFVSISNFIAGVLLLQLPPNVSNFHVQFGFQVSPQELLGQKAVRRSGWPGNVTIKYSDASGKQGSQTLH